MREQNEIFSVADAKNAGFQTKNVLKEEFGLEVPTELVPLPSEGKVYPEGHPLYLQKTVEIKAMTAKQEDILTSQALIKKGTVIQQLIKSCLLNPTIDVDSLISGDRSALMVSIRITGYGSDYHVSNVECPSCGKKSDQTFDLSNLNVKTLENDPVQIGTNVFKFDLPVSKTSVYFKYLTGKDDKELTELTERKKKLNIGTDASVTSMLTHSIVSVLNKDGKEITDRNSIDIFVKNMPARDSMLLRNYMTKNEPGIDMNCQMSCSHCGEESEVRLPMEASFFWPDK